MNFESVWVDGPEQVEKIVKDRIFGLSLLKKDEKLNAKWTTALVKVLQAALVYAPWL
jgi:hypothetical protein